MKNRQLLEEATQDPLGAQKALEVPEAERRGTDFDDETARANEDGIPDGMLTLPMSRIKRIVKLDPEHISSTESANYLLGVSAELFVMNFTKQAGSLAKQNKRKKIQYSDFHKVVNSSESLVFLKDLVPKTVPLGKLVKERKVKLRESDQAKLSGLTPATAQPDGALPALSQVLPPSANMAALPGGPSDSSALPVGVQKLRPIRPAPPRAPPTLAKGQQTLSFAPRTTRVDKEPDNDHSGDVEMID